LAAIMNPERMLGILRDTIVGTVRRDGPDLSARQFGVFLITYLEDGPHTVRGLAARLEVSKPAITRSLDRLAELGLAKRAPDPRDRGNDYLSDLRSYIAAALKTKPAREDAAEAA